ncbi:MAG TPA: protein kinase, partial [Lachnospiraceae bacterium]|nr:protein kinase [Lachnospiraceae bacterium]
IDGSGATALNPNAIDGSGATALNPNAIVGSGATALNPNAIVGSGATALNPNIIEGSEATSLNPSFAQDQSLMEQSILQPGEEVNQYKIINLLSKSGEAEVYHCEREGLKYVIKIYLKHISLKREIQELLVGKKLTPYLADMCEVNEFRIKTENGATLRYTYEIEPYYKTINSILSYNDLRRLIHDINEGIHVLHTLKETIIHKDIKPANIMMDDEGNYLLIDFGISSVIDEGVTSVKTSTGLTFDYAAPESRISNRFSTATDYYSLGITLYQLFTGEFPYADSNDRLDLLIRRGVIVPDRIGMPPDLVKLIQGLTFYNSNPDVNRRRWGYEEVKRWLKGDINLEPPIFQDMMQGTEDYMDDEGNYLLIDFGISSVMDEGVTSVKTSTGLTFDYAAPESRISNRFSTATDYYSLGITLYQLFTGEFPYADSNDRLDLLIRRGVIVPEHIGMPENLVKLIKGLTFYNSNPDVNHRRWGYDEVKRWLDGDIDLEPPVFQGMMQETGDYMSEDRMPPYIFMNVTYTNHLEFVMALGEHWEEGKKALFHGILTDHYKKIGNQTLIQYCMNAEDEQGNGNDDLVYFRFLYQIEPRLEKIYWKNQTHTEVEFGRTMILEPLWSCNGNYDSSAISKKLARIGEIQENQLLTVFYGRQDTSNTNYILAEQFESCKNENIREAIYLYYSMAYQMIGMKLFRLQSKVFNNYNEFAEFINKSLDHSFEEYDTLCNSLFQKDVQIDFYCWMRSLGMEDRVSQLAV